MYEVCSYVVILSICSLIKSCVPRDLESTDPHLEEDKILGGLLQSRNAWYLLVALKTDCTFLIRIFLFF